MSEATQLTPAQFVFSHEEYRRRCQEARNFYENRMDAPELDILGAIIQLDLQGTLDAAFEQYHEYRKAGYTAQPPMSGLPTARVTETPLIQLVTLYLSKPSHQQEKDLAVVCAKVKADYIAELEAALDAETDRQVSLILASRERHAARQQALEAERLEQEARDELAASRAKLRDQLIESGKLNADGSAA